MKCEEAAEFVSALCDGERIPREAAEHLGACEECRARLNDYVRISVELKRMASASTPEAVPQAVWGKQRTTISHWWHIGRESMRIPKFAFAFLLTVVVVLGSSLLIVKVRARGQGEVLMLTVKNADGGTLVRCALSAEDKNAPGCYAGVDDQVKGIKMDACFRLLLADGDRAEIGVRARFTQVGPGRHITYFADLEKLPETQYWLESGERLQVEIARFGSITLTGQWMNHVPPTLTTMGEPLDPNPDEIRFVSPVLLRNREVLQDFGKMTALSTEKGYGIELVVPDGRYELSLAPLEGAVEGRIDQSRVSFELNGQPYEFLTGAPVARGHRVWILHLPRRPSDDARGIGGGTASMSPYMAKEPKN
jgi:hypothetical protein